MLIPKLPHCSLFIIAIVIRAVAAVVIVILVVVIAVIEEGKGVQAKHGRCENVIHESATVREVGRHQ